jgi:hypothetical protein
MVSLKPQRASPPRIVAAEPTPPADGVRPHPWEMVQHPMKTVRFVNALRRDRRISWVRKLLYIGPFLLLLIALLLPEGVIAAGVALLLPVIGPLVNVPADAALDWFALGLAAYGLLGILPKRIVAEQHARLFHQTRSARG